MKITRETYADIYGPTVGDKVRLADTELFIEVEKKKYLIELIDKPLKQTKFKTWISDHKSEIIYSESRSILNNFILKIH